MKMTMCLVFVCWGLLSACSSDSGGGGNGPANNAPQAPGFDPKEKPTNPVSTAYVGTSVKALGKHSLYIPDDAAIMNSVITPYDIMPVDPQQQKEYLRLLGPEGQNLVNQIKANCTINSAQGQSTGQGDGSNVGDSFGFTAQSSVTGSTCPYVNNTSVTQKAVFVTIDNKAQKNAVTSSGTRSIDKALNDDAIIKLSGFKSLSIRMNKQGFGERTLENGQPVVNSKSSFTGTLTIVLADGETVSGPFAGEQEIKKGVGQSRIAFNGTSSKGNIRLLFVKSTDQSKEIEIFMNAERMNPRDWDGIDIDIENLF